MEKLVRPAAINTNVVNMKNIMIITVYILCTSVFGQSQPSEKNPIDSALAKKISVSGFCLCRTTLTDLQKEAHDFNLQDVEEMDLPKNCYGQDSRFISGKGYSSDRYSGLIFQKEEASDYISKIRLTKGFNGNLPNGIHIVFDDLKLKDVFQIYPQLKSKWGSRGCSDYWRFSNDTIAFFVKIDKSIKPQFPVNEAYYMDKPVEGIDLVVSCYAIFNKPVDLFKEPANEPLYFLDSVQVNQGVLSLYDPNEIAAVTVYKDTNAIRIAGDKGKNGVIYLTTKIYARDKYWKYFKSKSADYYKAVPSIKDDDEVIYVLNDKVLGEDFEGDLFFIDDHNFIDLKVIDKKQLKNDYKIKNKSWGIIITTNSKMKE